MEFPLSFTFGTRADYFLQSADDYHHHRHRTNKKLSKLKRSLKIITKDTKNYAEKEQVTSISSESYGLDIQYGSVLLFQIERDLLYGEEIRLSMGVENSRSKSRLLITKYKKALLNAKKLLSVASEETNQDRIVELLVYVAIIEGSLSVYKKRWSNAQYCLSVARCSLQYLHQYQPLPSQLNKELYLQLIDTIVDPALLVASLQLNQLNRNPELLSVARNHVNDNTLPYLSKAVEIIASKDRGLVTPASSNEQALITSIQWSEYSANLSSEDTAKSIMKSTELESRINELDSSYDESLLSWQETLNIHQLDMEKHKNDDDDEMNQDKHIVLTYINYNYLLLRIRRDITLLSNISNKIANKIQVSRSTILTNSKESLKILENILVSLNEIKELQGVSNEEKLSDSITSLINYFEASKIYKISVGYLLSNKYQESLALLFKSNDLLASIDNKFEFNFPGNIPDMEKINELKQEISKSLRNVHVLTIYSKQSLSNNSASCSYLIDNVNKFPALQGELLLNNVATLNTVIEPVNVKPVLFDIAFNYISYPGSEQESKPIPSSVHDANANAVDSSDSMDVGNDKKKKGGFFGLFDRN